MARTVNLVQLSTALRDQPFGETDSNCTMSFSEIPNVSAFRVVSASLPVSQYTFSEYNKTLTYGYETPSSFVAGDYIDISVGVWSTMGTDSGAFTFREVEQNGNIRYTFTGVIPPKFLTISEILTLINPPSGSSATSRVVLNSSTNKLEIEIDPTPAGMTVTTTLTISAYFPLGIDTALIYTRVSGGDPATPVQAALKVVDVQPRRAALTSFRWTPTTTTVFSFSDLLNSLNTALSPAILSIENTNTIGGPWISGGSVYRQLYLQNSNYSFNFTGFTSNAVAVTGIQYGEVFPSTFQNLADPVAFTRLSTTPANLTILNYYFTTTDFVFDTDRLYTEVEIIAALNTEFTPLAATWSAEHNRIKITTSSSTAIELRSNEVLGLRAPDWIVVPKEETYHSPEVTDLSSGTDVYFIGLPTLYSTGRSSQGSEATAVRRRDIVLAVANVTSVAFGNYISFYDQSGLFIPLGGTQSISSVRFVLYDQRMQIITTTRGIPCHLSIEFV
jgi:hypothetical protein